MAGKVGDWKHLPVNFLVGAPTYKIMEQSTRPTFMKFVSDRTGKYDGKDDAFRLKSGGSVYFRSSTDPDSVVGIPDCVAAWIDELGKCARMFYVNARGRVARMKGVVLGTTTPYASNFVKREIIDPCERGERVDILYKRWASVENPSYPREEYERLKQILPYRIFRMRVEGYHDKAEGLIFPDFSDENLCNAAEAGTNYGGVDWGFDHPLSITVRTITEDRNLYTISVFKKSGLSVTQQLDMIAEKTRAYKVSHWGCGSDRPDMILELQNRGISASKYFEFAPEYREVNAGNQKHAEIIKTKQLKVVRGIDQINDLIDEYETYRWDKDETDETWKERPVKENDDLMDAERYCTVSMIHLLEPKIPKVQDKLHGVFRDKWKPGAKPKSWDAY